VGLLFYLIMIFSFFYLLQLDITNICKGKSNPDISKLFASSQNRVIVLKSSKPLDQATLVKASLQAVQKSNETTPTSLGIAGAPNVSKV